MLKLFKRFSVSDWLIALVLIGVIVLQVYFDLELPSYTSAIMDEITLPTATTASIMRIGLTMLSLSLGSVLCSFTAGFLAAFLACKLAVKLRLDIFNKVQSFSFAEINHFSTASLITRSTNDIQQVQFAVIMLLRMAISAPITAVWAITKINSASFELTLAVSITVVILVCFLISLFLMVMPKFKLIQTLTDRLNAVTRENLTGLRVVKAYNADAYEQEKFKKVNDNVLKTNLFVNRLMGLMHPMMLFFMNALTLIVYWLGAYLISDGSLNFGDMIAFSMLVIQVLMAFMMMTMLFIMIPRASVSAKRINEVLETRLTILDAQSPLELDEINTIEFKGVGFKYPNAEDYVLKDISFSAKRGEVIAVIGSTGSGKSTLINLIPRFYDVSEGEILANGKDLRHLKQSELRSQIGYVPQKGVLFLGSIAENIAFGRDGMSRDIILKASKTAMADEFVSKMENGYDEHIAQGGKNVSGGQRQRLSIARASAISPNVYIFDDSFSALDFKTDKLVRQNLEEDMKEAICFIVAQRIGTILSADKIIVLDEGRIAGIGKHTELIKSCEVYREIALSQLSEQELA